MAPTPPVTETATSDAIRFSGDVRQKLRRMPSIPYDIVEHIGMNVSRKLAWIVEPIGVNVCRELTWIVEHIGMNVCREMAWIIEHTGVNVGHELV
jgi:hypothetical protein